MASKKADGGAPPAADGRYVAAPFTLVSRAPIALKDDDARLQSQCIRFQLSDSAQRRISYDAESSSAASASASGSTAAAVAAVATMPFASITRRFTSSKRS